MTRFACALVILLAGTFSFSQEKKEAMLKWELGSIGALKVPQKPADKTGTFITDKFTVREVIAEDKVLVESERLWQQKDRSSSGIGFSTTTLKKAALHKPFILQGPTTDGLKKKGLVKIEGGYKVVGTMRLDDGILYYVVSPVEADKK